MSSSDSDDDYGNITKKLEKLKNRYREANKDTLAKMDDSYELDRYLENQESGAKTITDSPPLEEENIPGPSLSVKTKTTTEKPAANTSKRRTRTSASKDTSSNPETCSQAISEFENGIAALELPLRTRRGRRGASSSQNPAGTRGRGRNRGRGSPVGSPSPRNRGRGRRNRISLLSNARLFDVISMMYPTHAIGDADEPYDHSRGQELFKKAPEPDIVTVDVDNETDPLEDNEELSVKVYWQSCELALFKIRKYQKIAQIFDHFAQKKNVSKDNLLFMYNDQILKPDDTPDSINYSIANLIDGGIVNQKVSNLRPDIEDKIVDGIKLKFQYQNVKKPFEMIVRLDDKFSVVMTKCAEHLEVPLNRLKFEFDGDVITSKNTARDLELEGGECIDIKVIS